MNEAQTILQDLSGGSVAKPRAEWVEVARRTVRNPQGALGLLIIATLVFAAGAAPLLTPYGPTEQLSGARLLPPSDTHPLGTDELGRDLLARVLFGLRTSLLVSISAVTGGAAVGALVGYVAGYVRGWTETVLMRLVDTMLAFPSLLAAIAIITVLGPGARNVAIAIGVFNVPVFARLARAGILAEAGKDYVTAARALGASGARILFRHMVINTLRPLLVQVALAFAFAILAEASLSFLGLGTQPPNPSLGSLLERGRAFLHQAVWYPLLPGAVLASLLVGFNFLADAVSEAADPRRHR